MILKRTMSLDVHLYTILVQLISYILTHDENLIRIGRALGSFQGSLP